MWIRIPPVRLGLSHVCCCCSNPDLRRSELSLEAMLQRTSSNSSSSSSPSSQGGSSERRGTDLWRENNSVKYRQGHWSWFTLQKCCQLLTFPSILGKQPTVPTLVVFPTTLFVPRCDSSVVQDVVSLSSALFHMSDSPCLISASRDTKTESSRGRQTEVWG